MPGRQNRRGSGSISGPDRRTAGAARADRNYLPGCARRHRLPAGLSVSAQPSAENHAASQTEQASGPLVPVMLVTASGPGLVAVGIVVIVAGCCGYQGRPPATACLYSFSTI
jgi:hypothetical protein